MRSLRAQASYLLLLVTVLIPHMVATAQDPGPQPTPISSPKIGSEQSDATTVAIPTLKPTREELIDALRGDNYSEFLPDDLPLGPIAITVRQHRLGLSQGGQSRRIVAVERQTVDPKLQ